MIWFFLTPIRHEVPNGYDNRDFDCTLWKLKRLNIVMELFSETQWATL